MNLANLFHRKPKPTKPAPQPTPQPEPPKPKALRYVGLNMAGSIQFTGMSGVKDQVGQVSTGLNKDGTLRLYRYPGGTDANSFYPLGESAGALQQMVQEALDLHADAVILVGNNTGTFADDLALIDAFVKAGIYVRAFEVGNEAYLGKYKIEVADYIAETRDRIANIKKHYPELQCGIAIMPIDGMKDTNNDEAPPKTAEQQAKLEARLKAKSEDWNGAILNSGVGDFYVQHFYPDGSEFAEAITVFAGQRYNKPVYLTECNASGTPEQQAAFYRAFAPVLRTLDWVPVVCWHNGPARGAKWPVVRITDKGTITPWGQAMIDA